MTRAATRGAIEGRGVLVLIVAILVFGLVWLYRFNTLGGALAGFDNDHFLHFVYAKQVQSGEQPLRDFLDAWQGARPSLTYEMSAAAQKYLGNNLRSEALLTVSGVALGAAVTFVAGSRLAPWPWALITALFSALLSPKLYGYPKVFLLAVAALIIVQYAAAPTGRRIALMAVWTAIAFLFRHDYAVYCGAGFIAVIAFARSGTWRTRAICFGVYALVTLILLGPSLWWIHRYAGLTEYLRNAREMSEHESYITRLAWPVPHFEGARSVAALLAREENTETWLYYLFLALPIAAIVVAVRRRVRRAAVDDPRDTDTAVLALGLMTLVLSRFLLRASLEARFGDMAPPLAVIAAVLLAGVMSRRASRVVPWLARATGAFIVLIVSTACVWALQSVPSELYISRIGVNPLPMLERAREISHELAGMPETLRVSGPSERMQAADYLNRCTQPSDRVLVVSYAPEVLAFAERLFAGDRATFDYGFYRDVRYSRRTIAALESESVPIALAEPETYYAEIPLLADYLRSKYVDAGTILANGRPLRVLTRRGKVGHPFGPGHWPCFT